MATRGWRVWQVKPSGLLAGMFNQEWPTRGLLTAECLAGQCKANMLRLERYDEPIPHEKPKDDETLLRSMFPYHPCGIYVMRTPEIAFEKAKGNTGLFTAIGEVDCFGRILPHEQAYRVYQARIRSVAVLTQDWFLNVDGVTWPAYQYWTPFGPIWQVRGNRADANSAYRADAMQVKWRYLPEETASIATKYGCDSIPLEILERIEGHDIYATEVVHDD